MYCSSVGRNRYVNVSCTGKFDDYNTDANATTKVTPGMIATQLILNITDIGGQKYSIYHSLLQKQAVWCEGAQEDNQYNMLSRVGFGDYTDFTNCQKMILEAASQTEAVQNSYKGLAKFLKAYRLYGITMKLGDIPYSDSNAAEGGNFTPKYDTSTTCLHIYWKIWRVQNRSLQAVPSLRVTLSIAATQPSGARHATLLS